MGGVDGWRWGMILCMRDQALRDIVSTVRANMYMLLAGSDQRRFSLLIPIFGSCRKEFGSCSPSALDYPLPPAPPPFAVYSLSMLVQPGLVSNNPGLSRLVPADP